MININAAGTALVLATFAVCATLSTPAMSAEQDNLEGYKVKDQSGLQVAEPHTLSNLFGSGDCELRGVQFLLTPAARDQGNDPNGTQLGSLVCYKAKCNGTLPSTPMSASTALGAVNLDFRKGRRLVCLPATVCGDGIVQSGESCDPGVTTPQCGGLTCNSDCTCPNPPIPACTGEAVVGDATWCLGDANLSCDAACASLGKTCDPETIFYAGSSGTDANCEAVLQALGVAVPLTNPSATCTSGFGCFVSGSSTYRCASPNSGCGSSSFLIQRACACY